ncbi:MAG: hypothetical protein ACE5IO_07460 [Thermoplasmata archaeon]
MTEEENILESNILEFLNAHGVEGFFRLYIREFLLQVFEVAVQSRSSKEEADIAYQYLFDQNGNMRSRSQLEAFNGRVEDRIADISKRLVTKLEDLGFFADLIDDIGVIQLSPEKMGILNTQLQAALKEVLGTKWGRYVRD